MYARLLEVVYKVTARPVRAEADCVEGAAQLGLVLGMTREIAQLSVAVRELTLVAVLARAALLVRPAELRLVARRRLAHAAIQFPVLLDQRGHQGSVAALQRRVSVGDVGDGGSAVRGGRRCRGRRRLLRLGRGCVLQAEVTRFIRIVIPKLRSFACGSNWLGYRMDEGRRCRASNLTFEMAARMITETLGNSATSSLRTR